MASENSALLDYYEGTAENADATEALIIVAEDKGKKEGSAGREDKLNKLTRLIERKICTEDLIHEVEKRPAIWDSRLECYSNKTEKLDSWNSILLYFINDFESKPLDERNILVTALQKKWKSIRTCYARELLKKKSVKSGSGAYKTKQYTYFEQLRFLETTSKKTANSLTDEYVEEGEEVSEAEERGDLNEPQSRPKTTRKRSSRSADDELIAVLKKKATQDVGRTNDNADEDKLFLLSLLSEVKKVPPENKLQLRANFISAIAQAQQQTMPTNFPTFSTPPYHTQTAQFPPSGFQYNIQPQHNFMQRDGFSLGSQQAVNFNHQSQLPRYSNKPSSSAVHPYHSSLDRPSIYDGAPPTTTPSPTPSDNSLLSQRSDFVTYQNN